MVCIDVTQYCTVLYSTESVSIYVLFVVDIIPQYRSNKLCKWHLCLLQSSIQLFHRLKK